MLSVAVRKGAASKGDLIVEVKAGEEIESINVAWSVERFVKTVKEEKKEEKVAGAYCIAQTTNSGDFNLEKCSYL